MNKITAEEARKVLTRYCNRCASHIPLKTLRYNDFAEKMDIMIKPVYDFIDQHKPPAFDEAVKAWEDIGYMVSVNYGDRAAITSVSQKGKRKIKHFSFIFDDCDVVFGQFVLDLSTEELNAINLTMQYLKSLKENAE